jgi:hypothetical protein
VAGAGRVAGRLRARRVGAGGLGGGLAGAKGAEVYAATVCVLGRDTAGAPIAGRARRRGADALADVIAVRFVGDRASELERRPGRR